MELGGGHGLAIHFEQLARVLVREHRVDLFLPRSYAGNGEDPLVWLTFVKAAFAIRQIGLALAAVLAELQRVDAGNPQLRKANQQLQSPVYSNTYATPAGASPIYAKSWLA